MILGNEQDSVLHHTYSYTIDFNPLLFPDLVLGLQTVHHITRRNHSESHKSCNSAYNDGSGGNISDMSTIVPYGLKSVGHCSLRTSRRKVGLGAKKIRWQPVWRSFVLNVGSSMIWSNTSSPGNEYSTLCWWYFVVNMLIVHSTVALAPLQQMRLRSAQNLHCNHRSTTWQMLQKSSKNIAVHSR